MIAARTASKMPVNHKGEAAGEHIKTVNAIINAEKTCLLGKDLPWVSFVMTGGISNFSYGRGLFTIYLKTDTAIKPTSGAECKHMTGCKAQIQHVYRVCDKN